MAPHLRRNNTGELVETMVRRISPTRASTREWEFDWTKPERGGYEVYALYVKGERAVQGLIALRDDPGNYAIRIDIMEAIVKKPELEDYGVMTEEWKDGTPTYNLRALFAYCEKTGKKSEELSDLGREQFRTK